MANLKKISVNNNVYDLGITEVATSDAKGLMSATDKAKLDAMKDASVSEAAIAAAQSAAEAAQTDATQALSDAATNAAAITTQSGLITAAQTDATNAGTAAAAAQAAAEAAQGDVDAVEGRVDTLETSMGTAEANITAHGTKLTELENAMQNLPTDTAITNLQSQIDAVNAAQNLADIVATKAALTSMDTSKLMDNDKVEVLADETKNGAATVYKFVKAEGSETGSFEFIGNYGQDAYTKSEIDTKLNEVEAHANKVEFSVADETLTISVTGHTA